MKKNATKEVTDKEVNEWIKKIESVKKGEVDLSRDEDLSIALMNLISLEEHFYFTAMKTENNKYLELLKTTRDIRKKLLAKIVTDPKGEEWCISKHLLATSMRLMEVGTKELDKGKKDEAGMYFRNAFEFYSMFFAINMKMVGYEKIKEGSNAKDGDAEGEKSGKFSAIIKKIVDCCKEW